MQKKNMRDELHMNNPTDFTKPTLNIFLWNRVSLILVIIANIN